PPTATRNTCLVNTKRPTTCRRIRRSLHHVGSKLLHGFWRAFSVFYQEFYLYVNIVGIACLVSTLNYVVNKLRKIVVARKLIEFEKRQMKGSDDHLYVGTPSQEVDDAWIRLIYGLNVNLDTTEIGKFAEDTFSWPQDGKFFTGVQFNHQLHCLTNFAKEHGESYTMAHTGHCINYLRHSIQCQADLTPMLWHEKRLNNSSHTQMGTIQDQATSALFLDMETTYTCRKWEPLHEWASSRQVNYKELKDLVQGGGKIQILD
ncbi:uncharacterized protein N7477_000932, partial [Penicillium maclennaniae]|uniref:uncharacterized protein n=1 Tax=Penicillium maclennaniae TaxID=1343394 RepID=UPI0025420542